ncbi:MAG: hypothetical protein ABIF71_07690 [Planctomycetota bacterium]
MSLPARWIHIDLKGLAPTVEALCASLERFAGWGATGFLFEIEDMFPYRAARQAVRADAYSLEEWQSIHATCSRLGTAFVPLIQTLGHLEWCLWHVDFAPLRLADERNRHVSHAHEIYQVWPCDPAALALIRALVSEVLECFPGLTYLHLGGDETWFEDRDPGGDYLAHMRPLFDIVTAAGVRPMIWGDMLLKYFETLDRLPADVIITDWIYSHRRRTGTNPRVWGEDFKDWATLSPGRRAAFGRHLYRGLPEGGPEVRLYPYPSYLREQGRPYFVCPAAQSCVDPFTHPTLAWKFDNGRSYVQEGADCGAAGAINTDWIVRRVMRELTRLPHYGFLRCAAMPAQAPGNGAIVRDYWNDLAAGSGGEAVRAFTPVLEATGDLMNETRPIAHRRDRTGWEVGTLAAKTAGDAARPGDAEEGDPRVAAHRALVEAGGELARFAGRTAAGLSGEARAEAAAWELAGRDMAVRARIWLLIRDRRRGGVVPGAAAIAAELAALEAAFRGLWQGRYLPTDIAAERDWRFGDPRGFVGR